jgi:hypothetical protein
VAGKNSTIAIIGLRDVEKSLKQFAPEMAKYLRQELRGAANLARDSAKSKVPYQRPLLGGSGSRLQSGWRSVWAMRGRVRGGEGWPAFQVSEIKRAIKVTLARTQRDSKTRTRTSVSIQTQNAAAAIYEFAREDHTPGQFSTRLPHYMGGRIMWAGYDSVAQQVDNRINDAIDTGRDALQMSIYRAKV